MKTLTLILLITVQNSFANEINLSFDNLSDYISSNGNYKGSQLEVNSQNSLTGHLKRSFLPALKASVGTANTADDISSKTENYNYAEAEMELNLFNAGRDSLEEKSRVSAVKVSQIRSDQTKFMNLNRARELYWSLVYQKEIIRILDSAIKLIKENQKAAQKRIAGGIATSTDRIDFEQSELQYKQDLLKTQISYENIERSLISVLNLPTGSILKTEELIPHSHDHSQNEFQNVTNNPESHRDFKFHEINSELYNYERIKLSRWWAPELDLYAGFTKRSNNFSHENAFTVDHEDGVVGGLRLTFEFDGFNNKNLSTSRSYQSLANEQYKKQRKVELDAEYTNALKLFTLNHDLVHSSEENIKKSETYLRNTRNEYLSGVKNSPDVLQASQRLISAQIRYAEVKKDYYLAKNEILSLLGK